MTQARELERESAPSPAEPLSSASGPDPNRRPTEEHAHHNPAVSGQVTRSAIRRLRALSRIYLLIIAVLVIAVVVLAIMFNQVRKAAIGWEQEADRQNAAAHDYGLEVALLRDELAETKDQLDTVSSQLKTAQAKITEQAADLANSDDTFALFYQALQQQEAISMKALDATHAYEQCRDGLTHIITYRSSPELYDPEQVEAHAEAVNGICEYAQEAHEELTDMIREASQ